MNPLRRRNVHGKRRTHYDHTPTPNPKPYPLTPTLVDEWVRVLIEEGIEPNPGPTFTTKTSMALVTSVTGKECYQQ